MVHRTEVLILQHPLEVHHAKNTAGLLHRSLSNSHLLVGEHWPESTLADAGLAPLPTWLLYPGTGQPHGRLGLVPTPQPDVLPGLPPPVGVRLVVLDATWRKSRSMLHRSPWLQSLPRWSLADAPASRYAIRKAHQPGQLSTLEAVCQALMQLEGDAAQCQPLLAAFDGFVAQQLAFRHPVV